MTQLKHSEKHADTPIYNALMALRGSKMQAMRHAATPATMSAEDINHNRVQKSCALADLALLGVRVDAESA